MRIALVHELLTIPGGAEQVLRVLAAMFPEAPIFTLLYDEQALGSWFPRERVRTASTQRLARWNPLPSRFSHHWYLGRFPDAVEAWDFRGFDAVISSSSAFAHGILTNGAPPHLSYIHAPARYLWDRTHDVLERSRVGALGPLRSWAAGRLFHRLRQWDSEAGERPERLLAASNAVARRIELYWRRESDVLYPPLADRWTRETLPERSGGDAYLVVSTLAPYKRIELAIEACNQRGRKLRIAGDGTDYKRLKALAGPTIEFLGRVPPNELPALYASAKATLFVGDEDFGLVPLESLACGTPVIAFRGGGALEIIDDGVTGWFFDAPSPASLMETMTRAECSSHDGNACRARAKLHDRAAFETGIRTQLSSLVSAR